MRTILKIIFTFVLLLVGTVLLSLVRVAMDSNGSTMGIGPFIIYPAMIAGIFAIWKYNPDKKTETSADKEILKKD